MLSELTAKLEKSQKHLENLIKRGAGRIYVIRATFKVLALEAKIEAIKPVQVQQLELLPQEVQMEGITLEQIKEAYESQYSRNVGKIWTKEGKRRIYLCHNNGIRTLRYGYIEHHLETETEIEWYEIRQSSATVGYRECGYMARAMQELNINVLTEWYVCKNFHKTVIE